MRWYIEDSGYEPNECQLTDELAVYNDLSKKLEKAERFDFSILGVIGVNSALFFVVIFAHIQLRREFLGSGLVYLEYFYLVMYLVILAVTLDAYLLSVGCQAKLLRYRDHLIPKLLYWPLLFGSGATITWLSLWLLDVKTRAICQ